MRYTQTTQQHATKPNTAGLQVIIQQQRRARVWLQMIRARVMQPNKPFQPFAYQGE